MNYHRTEQAWTDKLRQFDMDWEAGEEVAPYSADAVKEALYWGIAAACLGFIALRMMGAA